MASTIDETRRKRLRAAMQAKAKEVGRVPTVNDFKGGSPSYIMFVREYGSWSAAQADAGFEPRGRGRPRNEDT